MDEAAKVTAIKLYVESRVRAQFDTSHTTPGQHEQEAVAADFRAGLEVNLQRLRADLAAAAAELATCKAALMEFPGRSCSESTWNAWLFQRDTALRPAAGEQAKGP